MLRKTALAALAAAAVLASAAPAGAAYARPCTNGVGVEGEAATHHFTVCFLD